MIYPTYHDYISALNSAKECCRSRRLKQLKVLCDSNGEAIYSHYNDCVVVVVRVGSRDYNARLFLSEEAQQAYVLGSGSDYFGEEILVVSSSGMAYFDMALEPSSFTPALSSGASKEMREGRRPYCCQSGKWGYMDEEGRVVIEALYDDVEPFYEGRAVVSQQGCYGLIDREGREVIAVEWDEVSYDGSHLCYVDDQGRRGVLNRNGEVVVDCSWDWIAEESCGLFLVERDELLGYVNGRGEVVIAVEYDWATSFCAEGIASVKKGGVSYQIDTLGRRVSPQRRT